MDKDIEKEPNTLGNPENSMMHYSVPDGYFEALEERIMEQIPKGVPPRITWWTRVKPIVYLAASFAGIYYGFQATNMLSSQLHISMSDGKTHADVLEANDIDRIEYYQDYRDALISEELERTLSDEEYNIL